MTDWLFGNWGDIASALGLVVSIIGFSVAVAQTIRSRKAAESAERAVKEARRSLSKNVTIAELTTASERIQELRRIVRRGDAEPDRLFDMFYNIRLMLSDISSQHPDLGEDDRTNLQEAADTLGQIERRVSNLEYSHDKDEQVGEMDNDLLKIQSLIHKLTSDIKQSL